MSICRCRSKTRGNMNQIAWQQVKTEPAQNPPGLQYQMPVGFTLRQSKTHLLEHPKNMRRRKFEYLLSTPIPVYADSTFTVDVCIQKCCTQSRVICKLAFLYAHALTAHEFCIITEILHIHLLPIHFFDIAVSYIQCSSRDRQRGP